MSSTTFKKVFNIVSTIIVTLVVLIAIFLMGARIIGLNVYNVISGSMEPTYSVGDLIYVKNVEAEDVAEQIKVGDPVTFVLNADKVVATHRVVRVDITEELLYTKGDTNNTIDPAVKFNNVIGKPVFSIPLLGYVSDWMQTTVGMVVTIAVGLVLILLVFLPDILLAGKKKSKKDIAEETDETEEIDETTSIEDTEKVVSEENTEETEEK